jgi:hypothetical protein
MKITHSKISISIVVFITLLASSFGAQSASIAYIHGRVTEDGEVLDEGVGSPYDQMLLTDSGNTGLSQFKQLLESQGHLITQFRDKGLSLNASFLGQFDLVIFGLHQEIWSSSEKSALDTWLQAGGGMLIYSDSASGGRFSIVGAQNPVGQTVTNNLIAPYGMQVTVDQADGTTSSQAFRSTSIVGIRDLILEGEGVSPVAISPNNSLVEILIPYTRNVNRRQNLTINNPNFAALALRPVGDGHIAVMFDRQPMWNNGPGSDINERDNLDILREAINFLAKRPTDMTPSQPRSENAKLIPAIVPLLFGE